MEKTTSSSENSTSHSPRINSSNLDRTSKESENTNSNDMSIVSPEKQHKIPRGPFYSVVCEGRIAFGRYPTQYQVNKLVHKKFEVFVDLTDFPKAFYNAPIIVRFPIKDTTIPNESMRPLLNKVARYIDNGYKIYIHCEHGRGRSALLTAMFITILYKTDYDKTISILNDAHHQGHGNNNKWQGKLIPPHTCQRDFLRGFITGL